MPRTSFLQAGLIALSALALFAARPAHAQTSIHYENLVPSGTAGFFQSHGISSTGKTYTITNYDPSVGLNTYIVSNGVATPFALPTTSDLPNLPTLPSDAYSYLFGVNDSGTVAGTISDFAGNGYGSFVYTGGHFITPGSTLGTNVRYTAVSNEGKVALSYRDSSNVAHGALYDTVSGTFIDIPNVVAGHNTDVTAIASNGVLLGDYRDANDLKHGYTYYNGNYTFLPDVPGVANPPGVSNFEFAGINANGLIYGYYDSNPLGNGIGSFVYDGSGYTFLNYPGAVNTDIGWGISDTNQFVGSYYLPGASLPNAYLATVTITPEPGSIALLVGMSVAGAGFLRRRICKVQA